MKKHMLTTATISLIGSMAFAQAPNSADAVTQNSQAPEQIPSGIETSDSYSDQEVELLTTLVDVTSRPLVQLGEYAVLSKRAHTAKRMMDAELYDASGNEIGDVEDIIMVDGRATAIVVEAGGFLGVGEKSVEIPFSGIATKYDADDNEHRPTVSMTKDDVEGLPEFDEEALHSGRTLASKLIGQDVSFARTDDVNIDSAYLDDIVLTYRGDAAFAIVEYGGVLGIGEKAAAVNFDRLEASDDDGDWCLSMGPRDVIDSVTFVYSVDEMTGAASDKTEAADKSARTNDASEAKDSAG